MFTDNTNIVKLADKIYHYKGFLTPEELKKINSIVDKVETSNHYFEEIEFRPVKEIKELFTVWEKISDLLYPEYVIHPLLHMIKFTEGSKMLPHCDSPGEGNHEELTVPDLWGTCCLLSWGVITYFGDWEGGELYYPNQGIEIDVKPGDLVIHGALSDCMHGVKEITKGTRYAFSNFSLKAEKNPGSFYNYKTPDYYEAVKDLETWLGPIKENPKVIKMDELKYS
jgi:hypothetical protein